MNYPKKTGFNLYQSRHCAYITYSVKTWFLKILSVAEVGRGFYNAARIPPPHYIKFHLGKTFKSRGGGGKNMNFKFNIHPWK